MIYRLSLLGFLAECLVALLAARAEGGDAELTEYAARTAPFKIEVALEASLEPIRPTEVVLRPEDWAEFTIEELAPHGAAVRKGDVVLSLQRRKFNEAVRDQEAAVRTAELTIAQTKAEINLLEQSSRLELEEVRRARRQAEEDLRHFLHVGRGVSERQANLSVKSSEAQLNFALDELNQLEKMYQADHLTEETEEIILKRQREQAEQAKEYLELAKIARERTLESDLPRREQEFRTAQERSELALAKAEATATPVAEKKRLELAKLLEEQGRAVARLHRLKADEGLFKVAASADGLVYYGGWSGGQWSGDGSGKLRRGAAVQPNDVILSIVPPRVETARVVIPEKDLDRVEPGLKGVLTPTGRPELQIPATVKSIEPIPNSPGKFAAQVALGADAAAGRSIVPGMSATFRAISYYQRAAISIPLAAVHADGGDLTKTVVTINKDGQTKEVKLGRRTDKAVEILSGIESGQVLYFESASAK